VPAEMWLSVMRLRRGFLLRSLTGMCFGVCLALATSSAHPLSAQSATAGPSPAQLAEQADQPEAIVDQQSQPGNVVIDGRQVLSVYQSIGSFTPMDRAEKIRERITEVAREGVDPNSVVLKPQAMWTEISAGGRLLLAVSDEDAKSAGKARSVLASEYAENVRAALTNYRRDHNWRAVLRGISYSLLATVVLVPVVWVIRKLRLSARGRLKRWIGRRTGSEEKKTVLQIAVTQMASTVLAIGSVLRWLLLVALLETYITLLLSFFPQTRSVANAVTGWVLSALRSMGRSALAYLPNLIVVAVVLIIASQVAKLIRMFFEEIGKGSFSIKGFYPEWAEPTAKLIRAMVLILVIVIIFPYLPGSKSPAFQGISIFVGVLLSLGSSSAVANAIAGIILTYMRSFSVGDWVKIADTIGEVQEKSMLVTRILTQKQETITIPNATVMSGSVMNFTREAKNSGVIFHTTVTIGYDAPWRTVHQLLIDAARVTDGILGNPEPFVLQSQLNDFYVSYELNAYTDIPPRMQFIYSDLHQNIQDRFNEAGLEICSPHFASLRDGNMIAIPAQYVAGEYIVPEFRVAVETKGARQAKPNRP
jgi:small-conductance mechanosensitive channel